MKKRSILLLFIMIVILLPMKTLAMEYKDISESDWYYKDVKELSGKGIIKGYTDGTFKPNNKIKKSEALSLILGVNNIKTNHIVGDKWDHGLVKVASEKGFIDLPKYEGNSTINRQEVAEILVKAMGAQGHKEKTQVFKDTDNPYVNYLNSIGIVDGVEVNGESFYFAQSEITRAEISAIINRVDKYKNGFDMEKEVQEAVEKEIVLSKVLKDSQINSPEVPKSVEDFEKVFLNMASRNTYTHSLTYMGYTRNMFFDEIKPNLELAFRKIFRGYPEYYSFTNQTKLKIKYTADSLKVTIDIMNPKLTHVNLEDMRSDFIKLTENKLNELISEGKIVYEMSEREKAKVVYDWILLNTVYDYNFEPLNANGYGQIINGKTTCAGYTSTYNLMLKLLGIEAEGVTGNAGGQGGEKEYHIWTRAKLDGKWVYIDTTWGDAYTRRDNINYDYFAASREFLEKTHIFDEL